MSQDKHEREITDLIEERDYLHQMCDKLAACIAPDEVLGEHSSMNDPWANALEFARCTPPVEAPPSHPYGDSDNGTVNQDDRPVSKTGVLADHYEDIAYADIGPCRTYHCLEDVAAEFGVDLNELRRGDQ